MELKVDAPAGQVAEGGPYFRSRRASAGDGLFGGASAGFWVQLESTGRVRVKRLHPMATIGFSEPAGGFDSAVFHKVETRVRGRELRVALDGRPVEFDAGGVRGAAVALEPVWETASPRGRITGVPGWLSGVRRTGGRWALRSRGIFE